jgi:hypothetical protein
MGNKAYDMIFMSCHVEGENQDVVPVAGKFSQQQARWRKLRRS